MEKENYSCDNEENPEYIDIKKKEPKRVRFLGVILVFLIAIFYTTILELSNFLVTGSYDAPFVINWFNTIIFLLSFIVEFTIIKFDLIKEKKKRKIKNLKENINNDEGDGDNDVENNETVFKRYKSNFKTFTITDENGKVIKKGITLKKLFILSLPMSILFVCLNWIWMWALSMTEVSISTALYQSSTVFCFIFTIIILKEKIKFLKTLSVLLFVGGIIGIAVATFGTTHEKYPNALKGDLLLILSAALWAIYEVLTAKFLGECSRTVVSTYMGFIAFFSILWGIPVIAIFDKTNFEPFSLPDSKTFGLLFLNAIISYLINFLINWGLSVTSPLYVRAGELMTIPGTLVVDLIFKHIKFPLTAIPGYLLIVIGFILSIFVQSREIKKSYKLKCENSSKIILKDLNNIKTSSE